MFGELTLSGDSGASMPKTDASITASEYQFAVKGLKAGENTVRFDNTGKMLHHALLFPIAAGKTFADAKAALLSDKPPSGPPPVDFERGTGTSVISAGYPIVAKLDLAAGDYALVCFMPDKGTAGPPHVAKGMLQEVKIA